MSESWSKVSLGDVLHKSNDMVDILPNQTYKQITVRLWGQGVVLRGEVSGTTISSPRQYRACTGQFIVSRIDARNGAFGLVPEVLEGAVVTSDFPLFNLDRERIYPNFLYWLSRTKAFVELCKTASEGTTNRVRLKENRLLSTAISLPPIHEQRRIVTRIKELVTKVESVKTIRDDIHKDTELILLYSISEVTRELLERYPSVRLEDITKFVGDMNHEMPKAVEDGIALVSPKDFEADGKIRYSQAKKISVDDFRRLSIKCRPEKGDTLMARYGTIGAARYVDVDFPFLASYSIAVIKPDEDIIDGKFLYWMVTSPFIQAQATDGIRGSGMADLGLKSIRRFLVPILPRHEQWKIVEQLEEQKRRCAYLQQVQSDMSAESDALTSSILNAAFKGDL